MPEDLYPYRVEPGADFADRLETELLRRLHGTLDAAVDAEPAVDRPAAAIGHRDDGRLRRGGIGRRGRRWMALGIAAACLAVAFIGVALWRFPSEQSAAAAVRDAIERQQSVDSYEATATVEHTDGLLESGTVRVDGNDAEVDWALEHRDGRTENFTITAVGERVYSRFGGDNVVSPRRPDDGIQPSLSELSTALRGVLDNSDVTRVGNDVIAGREATRYEIEINDHSRTALADPVLGFEPARVASLTIWVAGGYPRQVEWTLDDGEHTIFTMLSIGDDLDITVPPGEFTFDPEPEFLNP
jgi:hypothetical protein